MKKISMSIIGLLLITGTAVQAKNTTGKKADCCKKGAVCCQTGNSCCK